MWPVYAAFWLSALFLAVTHVVYPLAIGWAARRWRSSPRWPGTPTWPKVSVIIAVHNGGHRLLAKVDNVLQSAYPQDKLEVVVVSDGSTDGSDELLAARADPGVRVLRLPRGGKSAAQNAGVAIATGDIVVLTDVDTELAATCLAELVQPFGDPSVGCVDCNLQFRNGSGIVADHGLYWRYECWLRNTESALGLGCTTSGACMAVRRSALSTIDLDVGEDCVVPLDIVGQGLRVYRSLNARAYDHSAETYSEEYRVRVRMTLRNWIGTVRRGRLLNPVLVGWLAPTIFFHKISRWLTPFYALILLSASAILALHGSNLGRVTFGAWVLALTVSVVGLVGATMGRRLPVAASLGSLLMANIGFAHGVVAAWAGHRQQVYR